MEIDTKKSCLTWYFWIKLLRRFLELFIRVDHVFFLYFLVFLALHGNEAIESCCVLTTFIKFNSQQTYEFATFLWSFFLFAIASAVAIKLECTFCLMCFLFCFLYIFLFVSSSFYIVWNSSVSCPSIQPIEKPGPFWLPGFLWQLQNQSCKFEIIAIDWEPFDLYWSFM